MNTTDSTPTFKSFIKARTPEKLVRAQIEVMAKDNVIYNFTSITYDGKNWYAWYNKQIELSKEIKNEFSKR
jgi:hypothetical protein